MRISDEKLKAFIETDNTPPKGEATHIDIDGDYFIITPSICFIWNGAIPRMCWVEYANHDELDIASMTPLI